MLKNFEKDEEEFNSHTYTVDQYPGVACFVLGWEVLPDEESEMIRTGKVIAVMVGDDHKFSCGRNEIKPLQEGEYCLECGQIGCQAVTQKD